MAKRGIVAGMADKLPPPMTAERLMEIARGQKPIGVLHACPDCVFGQPSAFCPTCLGIGTVSGEDLDRWQVRANDRMRKDGV